MYLVFGASVYSQDFGADNFLKSFDDFQEAKDFANSVRGCVAAYSYTFNGKPKSACIEIDCIQVFCTSEKKIVHTSDTCEPYKLERIFPQGSCDEDVNLLVGGTK